jgi:Tol biopolymer transport system component
MLPRRVCVLLLAGAALAVGSCAAAAVGNATSSGWLAANFGPGGGPVWRVDPASGKRRILASNVHADALSWSRDGKALLYTDIGSNQAWLRALDTRGRPLPVRVPNASFGTFSPDGTQVVYEACVAFCIATSDLHGRQVHYLVKCKCLLYNPAWSPDGKQIAYLRQRDYHQADMIIRVTYTIRLRALDGSNDHELVGEGRYCDDQGDPRWSPNGAQIAFACGQEATYVMNASGGPARRAAPGGVFAWSPDGLSLAYSRENVSNPRQGTIGVVNLATGASRILDRTHYAYSLAWHA